MKLHRNFTYWYSLLSNSYMHFHRIKATNNQTGTNILKIHFFSVHVINPLKLKHYYKGQVYKRKIISILLKTSRPFCSQDAHSNVLGYGFSFHCKLNSSKKLNKKTDYGNQCMLLFKQEIFKILIQMKKVPFN